MIQDVYQIIVDAQGQQAITDAESRVNSLKQQLDQLIRNAPAMSQWGQATRDVFNNLSRDYAQATADLQGLQRAFGQLPAAGGNAAQGLLQLSYAIDDLQYGFRAIQNNIPGLIMGFGGSAGLAGAVGIAATGAYVLYNNWDDLMGVLGLDTPMTAAERMEYLGNKTHKTAAEQREYNKLKREEAEIEAVLSAKSDAQREGERMVTRAIAEGGGGDKIVKGLIESRQTAGTFERMGAQDRENLDFYQKMVDEALAAGRRNTVAEGKIKEIRDRINKEGTDRARQDVGLAATDPQRLRVLIGEVSKNPGAFPPGFLGDLTNALPENIKQQAQFEAEGRLQGQQVVEHQREIERQAKDAERDRMASIKGDAKAIAGRRGGTFALGAGFDEASVKAELQRSGADASRSAEVFAQVQEMVDERLRQHGLETGLDPEAARQDLIRQQAEREANEGERGARDAHRRAGGGVAPPRAVRPGVSPIGRVPGFRLPSPAEREEAIRGKEADIQGQASADPEVKKLLAEIAKNTRQDAPDVGPAVLAGPA